MPKSGYKTLNVHTDVKEDVDELAEELGGIDGSASHNAVVKFLIEEYRDDD